MLGYRYDNSYLKLSSFDFFFEHFFSDFSTPEKYWCCQRFLPSFPSPSPPLLAFFRSTCIIGHQMFAFIEIEKTRLIWHKNILRYYFLWFFVMIVIPNTYILIQTPKPPKKLVQVHRPSGITSILVQSGPSWSFFCNF